MTKRKDQPIEDKQKFINAPIKRPINEIMTPRGPEIIDFGWEGAD